jgi:uncharacterized coiled-coil DUF342 family protein
MSKEYIINEYVRDFSDLIDVIQKIERKYNELYEQVNDQEKINELNEEIDELEDEISELKDTRDKQNQEIVDLRDELSRLERLYDKALGEIETLKSDMSTE